jgi:hypothetical protein
MKNWCLTLTSARAVPLVSHVDSSHTETAVLTCNPEDPFSHTWATWEREEKTQKDVHEAMATRFLTEEPKTYFGRKMALHTWCWQNSTSTLGLQAGPHLSPCAERTQNGPETLVKTETWEQLEENVGRSFAMNFQIGIQWQSPRRRGKHPVLT